MRKYIHLSPNLGYVEIEGEYPNFKIKTKIDEWHGEFLEATSNENKLIQAEFLAEKWVETEILCCQSSLVDHLMKMEHPLDGFSWDDIENLYEDTTEFSLEECKDYLLEYISSDDLPDPNPWEMTREELTEFLGETPEDVKEFSDDQLRNDVISGIDNEVLDGIEEWRQLASDVSQDNPQEPLEWWLVTGWLCQKLREAGEPVLDNDYGCWFGRTCSGQAIIADGVLQQIALKIL